MEIHSIIHGPLYYFLFHVRRSPRVWFCECHGVLKGRTGVRGIVALRISVPPVTGTDPQVYSRVSSPFRREGVWPVRFGSAWTGRSEAGEMGTGASSRNDYFLSLKATT